MSCLLCFGVELDGHLVDIVTSKGRQCDVASILHTHFRFCFQVEPIEGYVCQKCWVKVSVFHEFYTHIEYVHRSKESVFVENIILDVKPNVDLDGEKWEMDSEIPLEQVSTDEKPTIHVKRKRGRPRKNTFTKLEEPDTVTNNADHSNDLFENTLAHAPTAGHAEPNRDIIKEEKQPKTKPVKKLKSPRDNEKILFESDNENETDSDEDEEKSADPTWTETNKSRYRRQLPNEFGTFQCKTCDLHFLSFFRLERHTKETHDAKEFKCKARMCVDSFETQQLLEDHMAERHTRKECPHCKKMIIEINYEHHLRTRHDASQNVCCELCGEISINKLVHNTHYRAVHELIEILICDICTQSFKNKDGLRSHMTNKHIYGPEKCDVCGHHSPNRKALNEHKRLHKPGSKDRWKCDVCGRGFCGRSRA